MIDPWWLTALRIAALTGMLTSTGIIAVQLWRLREVHRPRVLFTTFGIGLFGSLLLTLNLFLRVTEFNETWLALSANIYFLGLSVTLIREGVRLSKEENARRLAEKVERKIIDGIG